MTTVFRQTRWRLVRWNLLVIALLLLLAGGAVYVTLAHSLLAAVDSTLAGQGTSLAPKLQEIVNGDRPAELQGYQGALFYLVLDPTGHVFINPQGVPLTSLPLRPDVQAPWYATGILNGQSTRLYFRPLLDGSSVRAVLVVGQHLDPVQATLRRLLVILLAGGALSLLAALAGAWFLAGRALVPIERAFARQQAFVADASHELRTPLTVMRTARDLLEQHRAEPLAANGDLFDDMGLEMERMQRLIADLLTLAHSDAQELQLALGRVDLVALTATAIRRMTPLAQTRKIALSLGSREQVLLLEGDPDKLEQVVLILLDNALKHTPAGGHVTATATRQGGEAVLQVADSGAGIAPEHLPHIFGRFYRADAARSRKSGSTGLGLAIATSLIEAHQGRLALTSTVGVGTTATIHLPLRAPHATLTDRLGRVARRVARRPGPA